MSQGEYQPEGTTPARAGGVMGGRQQRTWPVSEQQRRSDAQRAVRLSDVDAQSIAIQGVAAVERAGERHWSPDTPKEVIAKWREDQQRESEEALRAFKATLLEREYDIYLKGVDDATDRRARGAANTRSVVLLLVVLVVVAMPIIAIFTSLSPQDFGSYIAPVTGIAGTVVGYWFGAGDRQQTRS